MTPHDTQRVQGNCQWVVGIAAQQRPVRARMPNLHTLDGRGRHVGVVREELGKRLRRLLGGHRLGHPQLSPPGRVSVGDRTTVVVRATDFSLQCVEQFGLQIDLWPVRILRHIA